MVSKQRRIGLETTNNCERPAIQLAAPCRNCALKLTTQASNARMLVVHCHGSTLYNNTDACVRATAEPSRLPLRSLGTARALSGTRGVVHLTRLLLQAIDFHLRLFCMSSLRECQDNMFGTLSPASDHPCKVPLKVFSISNGAWHR